MNNVFTAPISWSEQVVGKTYNFVALVILQVLFGVVTCFLTKGLFLGAIIAVGVGLPLMYLWSLRQLLTALRKHAPRVLDA